MLEETSNLKPINGTMEARSDWYNKIVKEINSHKDRLSQKEQKKYKLDLLLRLAGRVDSFSTLCGECQYSQQEITQLTKDLGDLVQTSDLGYLVQTSKEKRKSYFKAISNITKHLQKEHKLVTEGHYSGMWGGIGTAIGVGIGAGAGNVGIGLPIGIAIGVAVGRYLDNKAKKEGRVI